MVKQISECLLGLCVLAAAAHSFASSPSKGGKNLLQPSLVQFQTRQVFLNLKTEGLPAAHLSTPSFSPAAGYKSKGRAFLQSLILPGWGQYYARSHTMFKIFAASEAALWGVFTGFTLRSNWLENDYRNFAATHAGINPEGKPADYFVDIGNFVDIFEYNQAQLRNRDVAALYPETDEFFWRWDSDANRRRFENLRVSSDRASNRADLTLALIFVNHLFSAVQATMAVHNFNKRLAEKDVGMNIQFEGLSEDRRVQLIFVKRF